MFNLKGNKTNLSAIVFDLGNVLVDWDPERFMFDLGIKPEFIPAEASDEGEEDFRIVRTKRFSLKPMTPEEAILQMNLLEHEFFVFLNMEDNDSFSVVYKRNEGGYGLISAADV